MSDNKLTNCVNWSSKRSVTRQRYDCVCELYCCWLNWRSITMVMWKKADPSPCWNQKASAVRG